MTEPELREIALAVIRETYAKAREVYGREFPMPTLVFDLTGRAAGRAHWKGHIQLNPVLMEQNLEVFKERTIPHECAHLIEYIVTGKGGHGWSWQEVMRKLGVRDMSRCHSYDTSGSNRKELTKWRTRSYR